MRFTERLLRAFAMMDFLAYLAKSELSYTFLAIVRSPTSTHWCQLTNIYLHPHVHPRSLARLVVPPQSSPAVGISFCLIIVRLGQILPEVRDKTWHGSAPTPASRKHTPGQVSVLFPQVKVQRDVYVSGLRDFPMESLESQKDGYTSSPADLPRSFRSSLSPPITV